MAAVLGQLSEDGVLTNWIDVGSQDHCAVRPLVMKWSHRTLVSGKYIIVDLILESKVAGSISWPLWWREDDRQSPKSERWRVGVRIVETAGRPVWWKGSDPQIMPRQQEESALSGGGDNHPQRLKFAGYSLLRQQEESAWFSGDGENNPQNP
ncbi:hypothetical protein ACROYT_G000257 [Oculina patagonica]